MAQEDAEDAKAVSDQTKEEKPAVEAVSWFRLFDCDAFDYLAVFLGVVGSLANAPIMPLFAVVFGDVCSLQYCTYARVSEIARPWCRRLDRALWPMMSASSSSSTRVSTNAARGSPGVPTRFRRFGAQSTI